MRRATSVAKSARLIVLFTKKYPNSSLSHYFLMGSKGTSFSHNIHTRRPPALLLSTASHIIDHHHAEQRSDDDASACHC